MEVRRTHVARNLPLLKETGACEIPVDSDKYATFVDFRRSPFTEYALRNVMFFLGRGWGLQIFVPADIGPWIARIVKDWQNVQINELPAVPRVTGRGLVDNVLRQAEFWNTVRGEWQLMFNSDTMFCRSGIEEFMQYDYVGAPWPDHVISPWCRVGGGGLSLRRKQAMLEICESCNTNPWIVGSEDAFFSINMHLLSAQYRLPSLETARRFAVEQLYYPRPLSVHRAWHFIAAAELESILDRVDYGTGPR